MPRMGRKKKTPENNDMPQAPEVEAQSDRSKDRHKPRKTVALPPRIHELLQALAEHNTRPLNYELRLAVIAHLRAAGWYPSPPPDAES